MEVNLFKLILNVKKHWIFIIEYVCIQMKYLIFASELNSLNFQ